MDKGNSETIEARKWKDSLLKEIFIAYRESGALYKKTANPVVRQDVLDMKRGFDLAIQRLIAPDASAENTWQELKAQFAS
ncbi:MAG TPA: hypothetical protein VMB22_00300 [Verrucomicrobiae bacterium]|nr:hypothetical protein [Verrucomicrobiae bacterium]